MRQQMQEVESTRAQKLVKEMPTKERNVHKLKKELGACRIKRVNKFLQEDLQKRSILIRLKNRIIQILVQPKIAKSVKLELAKVLEQVERHLKRNASKKIKSLPISSPQNFSQQRSNHELKFAFRIKGDEFAVLDLHPETQGYLQEEDAMLLHEYGMQLNSDSGKKVILDDDAIKSINEEVADYCCYFE
jgi:hypothetical protein